MDALGKIVALEPEASAAICSLLHQVPVGGSIASLFPGDGQLMLPVVFMGYVGSSLEKPGLNARHLFNAGR